MVDHDAQPQAKRQTYDMRRTLISVNAKAFPMQARGLRQCKSSKKGGIKSMVCHIPFAEGEKLPIAADTCLLSLNPAAGSENMGIRTPDVRVSVYDIEWDREKCAFGNDKMHIRGAGKGFGERNRRCFQSLILGLLFKPSRLKYYSVVCLPRGGSPKSRDVTVVSLSEQRQVEGTWS